MFKSIFNYPVAFLLLLITIGLINLLFTGIFKSVKKSHFTLLIIVSIFLLINDLKYIIMLNPVSLSDIHFLNTSNIGTAGLYLKTVNGTWIIKTIVKFIVMILISVYVLKVEKKDAIESLTKRLLFFFVPIILIPVFFIVSSRYSLFMVKKFYGYNYDMVIETTDYGIVYYNMGLYQGIIFNHYALNVHEPDNYDKDEVISILNEYKYKLPDQNFGNPNIVIILSEAFSDITNLPDITFDKDILYNIHELDKKSDVIVANTKVSTFGGSSVISEWEMLTSSSNNFNPAGYIAYTEYYKDKYKNYIKNSPSIIKTLNKEGYTTKYITPWSNESYNSGIVYKTLGIDETKYNIEGIKKGFYLADSEINKSILNELNTDPNTPKLLIYATAENHMPCSLDKFESYDINVTNSKLDKENTDLIKCYAQGVYDADSALGNLYNDIQNIDKDTIVIFFGDHLPFITNNKGDNSYLLSRYFKTSDEDLNDLRKYTTKGVIFSNYIENLDKSIDYVNLNYLSAYVYANLDIKNNEYFKFVNDMRKIVPVFSKTYILDNNKLIKQKNISKDQKEALEKLRNVQFYSFYDNN